MRFRNEYVPSAAVTAVAPVGRRLLYNRSVTPPSPVSPDPSHPSLLRSLKTRFPTLNPPGAVGEVVVVIVVTVDVVVAEGPVVVVAEGPVVVVAEGPVVVVAGAVVVVDTTGVVVDTTRVVVEVVGTEVVPPQRNRLRTSRISGSQAVANRSPPDTVKCTLS